jgi:hypothetical protein
MLGWPLLDVELLLQAAMVKRTGPHNAARSQREAVVVSVNR